MNAPIPTPLAGYPEAALHAELRRRSAARTRGVCPRCEGSPNAPDCGDPEHVDAGTNAVAGLKGQNMAKEWGLVPALPSKHALDWKVDPRQATVYNALGQYAFIHKRLGKVESDPLFVIVSANVERDGRRWAHVSASRLRRLPDYADLVEIKRVFLGPDLVAVHVFPRGEEHFNLAPTALHLWACLDGDAVPDLRHPGGGV
jgi:hypothetical protein